MLGQCCTVPNYTLAAKPGFPDVGTPNGRSSSVGALPMSIGPEEPVCSRHSAQLCCRFRSCFQVRTVGGTLRPKQCEGWRRVAWGDALWCRTAPGGVGWCEMAGGLSAGVIRE